MDLIFHKITKRWSIKNQLGKKMKKIIENDFQWFMFFPLFVSQHLIIKNVCVLGTEASVVLCL